VWETEGFVPALRPAAEKRRNKPCKFCGIAEGSEKSFTVFADDVSVAFLDYRPLMPGHVLLVPRGHYETLAATPDAVMAELGVRVKRLSAAVMTAMEAEGSFVALNNVVSQSVPHVHFHIVPRRKGDGLFASGRMIWKRVGYKDDAEREAVAARIRATLTI
jgi:histidine triad (HIT) family protein